MRHETELVINYKDLTLYAIPVVVTMSNLIVKQHGDVFCRYLKVLVFALEIGNLVLERSLVLF